jgi:hypothetical protein
MKKKLVCFVVLIIGIVSVVPAEDQFFFNVNIGVAFYPAIGAKVGWMHYWDNEKIGLVADVSYYNNGLKEKDIKADTNEDRGDWTDEFRKAHNLGIAAGVVFNNMGMSGVIRTAEYVKLKGLLKLYDGPVFYPCLDFEFKFNVFFTDRTAFSAGLGIEFPLIQFPYYYFSLGMVFTL